MAPELPLTRLVLAATSVADDLGHVALSDLVSVMSGAAPVSYRVIGGHMVTALVARWRLGTELYRETGDTDLGVPPIVVRDHGVVERLVDLGYAPIGGNRFARPIADVAAGLDSDDSEPPVAVIDVLVPAYTSRPRQDRRVGEKLVTTEVPGLATALRRDPLILDLALDRLNGERIEASVTFPDEVSALVLKAHATEVRSRATDVVDLWRCLEVGLAAGLTPAAFAFKEGETAVEIVRRLFADRHGPGMRSLLEEQALSKLSADQRFTRIRALASRLFDGA